MALQLVAHTLLGNHCYTITMLVCVRGYSQSTNYSCNWYSSMGIFTTVDSLSGFKSSGLRPREKLLHLAGDCNTDQP